MSSTSDRKKSGPAKGAAGAVREWQKDGDREDQDYYHVPGSDKRDREEVESATRKRKKT
ncbi:hypothetical protein [Methyloceanibacter superfactus]|uniref:hypothetical protein n=1 Tax=Methyloceanibacter superfactus TaxID=1774969 RepID=UPI0013014A56|nr:hypothetical protein [Methyloceanibacter superfactus]